MISRNCFNAKLEPFYTQVSFFSELKPERLSFAIANLYYESFSYRTISWLFRPHLSYIFLNDQVAAGKEIEYEAKCSDGLSKKLLEIAEKCGISTVIGNTLSSNDFYEGMNEVSFKIFS